MPTPVVMPQMGESIAEGTIVRWMKKVGDPVERDEPLFEITTDKVDAEIPAPAAGVLAEIKVKEGETVAVNSVVGTIAQPGEEAAKEPPRAEPPKAAAPLKAAPPRPVAVPAPAPSPASREELRRQKSSPLVRRIARENNVDISAIAGSGIGGRVTKHDILAHIGQAPGPRPQASAIAPPASGVMDRVARMPEARSPQPEARVEIQPLSPMRKKIAEHMVLSRRTSAHVHSVFHVNFSHVERLRREKKDEYARLGARLTYMAFIAKAVIDAIRRHPVINASLDGDNVVYKKDVNVGIAVALESGLIVPVIRNADEKNLLGLARAIADIADRARAKQLKPEEVHGGTFTITNPGQFGSQFGLPIINQPQVAILAVGTIEKRPVVVDDAIAIRTMAYLTLGYDHRLVDGAIADQFMSDVKTQIEQFDPNQV
ncbi:MAG: 2-oxo acid dehydrogenase subunit E2 [Acidobacteria bacterium]|nr:2-oxo acid dehydrogenase subunit E2 [Acidobacteriota bacterium]